MKTKILTIILFLFLANSMLGQSNTKPYYFSLSYASEPYDDRIFGFHQGEVDRIKQENIEKYAKPTEYLKAEVGYSFFFNSKLQFNLGVGFGKEWNIYYRNYNHCVIESPCTYDLKYLDRFNYNLINLNIDPKYQIISYKNWKLIAGVGLLPSIKLISRYHDKNSLETRILNKFDFFSMEINPNLGISYRQFGVEFFYRLWQIKKVDRVIHAKGSTLGHPVLVDDFEKRNPTKFGVTLKYYFNLERTVEK